MLWIEAVLDQNDIKIRYFVEYVIVPPYSFLHPISFPKPTGAFLVLETAGHKGQRQRLQGIVYLPWTLQGVSRGL